MARGQRDLGLEQQRRERMSHWRASGLNFREFCQRRGLTEPTFHGWKWGLRVSAVAGLTTDSKLNGNSSAVAHVW